MTRTQSAREPSTVEENPTSQAGDSTAETKHAWAPVSVIVIRFAVIAALIGADLWSKARVFEWLTANRNSLTVDDHGHVRYLIFGEWFTFMKSLNSGAAFGQLASVPHLLIGGRVIAVLFLSWMVLRATTTRRVFTAALMLVLAGAAGNLWDNLFMAPPSDHPYGEVRDFIDVYFSWIGERGWHFPTFNVADSCITVGAVLLLLSGFAQSDQEPTPELAPSEEPAGSSLS